MASRSVPLKASLSGFAISPELGIHILQNLSVPRDPTAGRFRGFSLWRWLTSSPAFPERAGRSHAERWGLGTGCLSTQAESWEVKRG